MIGRRIGSYEVVAKLGEGGMGEVYRARDTRLDRDVALKILPQAFAADPERLRRFEREAKTLASLNHPNIAQIYGVEDVAGGLEPAGSTDARALVMELVPGRTLAELIQTGALPPSTAISIASQIADALEAAHEAGIVHRDLKPANVKVRDDDVVKVLDFGLARATGVSEATGGASDVTALSPAATQQGVILGTAGYMSPEQARGKVADKRADIWAFGVVLYEMLTGKRLFGGDTVTEIIASVIKDSPRLEALPANTPPMLRHLLARCLERDPKLRLRDIGEARVMLANPSRWAADPGSGSLTQRAADTAGWPLTHGATGPGSGPLAQPAQTQTSHSLLRTVVLVTGAIALAGLAVPMVMYLKSGAPASITTPVRRFELPAAMANAELAISRDGSRIAYFAGARLYVYELRTGRSTDLGPVPAATKTVFFSPDGQRIAYGAEATLRVVPISGGPPFIVSKIPASGVLEDGTWLDDGTIYVAVWRDSLYRVADTGGPLTLHAPIDAEKEVDFHSVDALPGNRLVVVTHLRGQDGSRADVIDAGVRTPLVDDLDISVAAFVADNLVFSRTRTNVGVWTVPFGDGKIDLAKAVLVEPDAGLFVVSDEGTLVALIEAREQRDLIWVTPDSGTSPSQSARKTESMRGTSFDALSSAVALSPDDRRAVVTVRGSGGKDELLVRELATGTDTRVPMPQASTGMSTGARVSWSPTGRLLIPSGGVETLQIYDWPADGSTRGQSIVQGSFALLHPTRKEVIVSRDEGERFRLYRAPILPDGTAGKAEPVFSDTDVPGVRWFDLSKDGTLLAFTVSDPTTRQLNVFVTTWPDLRERRQVTSNGGTQPHFSRDGRQLYFLTGSRASSSGAAAGGLSVVTLTRTPLTASAPRMLLQSAGTAGSPTTIGFDVAADGRLLMTRVVPTAGQQARTVLLQNWMGSISK